MSQLSKAQGRLVLNMPESVDTLLQKTLEKNKETHSFSGYRIQIFQTTDRKKAFEIKKELISIFPDEFVVLIFNEPNYKIRLGNYRNKIEAQKMYHVLMKMYPQTFVIPDKIDIEELN
jgi:hypothetical protein